MSEEADIQAKIDALATELAKDLKTESDLAALSRTLLKTTVEKALGAEMEAHLDNQVSLPEGSSSTRRNGHSKKVLKSDRGDIPIDVPRDRDASFEPQLVKKHQRRLTQFDDQILSLYARGMSTRDIVATFKELYSAEVSPTLISKVTDAVIETVNEWQQRPLERLYPIVYLDGLVVKVRHEGRVINKTIYLVLGINLDGEKELLGMWLAETEGAKFWLNVLTELQNRGLEQICIACVDGLSGFPEAINTAYPATQVQLCIVHLVRNSLRYVSWKDRKRLASALREIYTAPTETAASEALERFAQSFDEQYPAVSRLWRRHWEHIIPLFGYPPEIRKVIYTTNAIESLNSVIRKAIKNRRIFPSDISALKLVYLAVDAASKKWTMPIRDWKRAMNHFIMQFDLQIER